MKRHCLYIAMLLMLSATGCHSNDPLPEGVLTPDAYTELLTDLYLAEGICAVESDFHYQNMDSNLVNTYDTLLIQHQVTPEIFEATTAYYLQHREQMNQIYEQVLENLNQD